MVDVEIIIGLPGSGKSTLAADRQGPGVAVFDDFHLGMLSDLKARAGQGDRIVIADPHLVVATRAQILGKLDAWLGSCSVEFTVFENDPEACWHNIVHRKDERLISKSYVTALSRLYRPDAYGVEPIAVVRAG